jgi:hypothetical protein
MDRYTHLALANLTSALDRLPAIGGSGHFASSRSGNQNG